MPDIDLKNYRWHAAIDWLKVRVDLVSATQFQWVQEELKKHWHRKCYLETVDPGPGNVSDRFDIIFQEPRSSAHAMVACSAISARFPMRSPPELSAIEISVDAYPKIQTDEARARLLGVLQRTIFPCRDIFSKKKAQPRFCIAQGHKPTFLFATPPGRPSCLDSALWSPSPSPTPVDSTLYLGPKCGPVMVRAMDKVVDQQNRNEETLRVLERAERRTRIEVTLHSAELSALGMRQLGDLQAFSFTALQGKYFQFKLPAFGDYSTNAGATINAVCRALERRAADQFFATGVIGLVAMNRARDELRRRLRQEIVKHAQLHGQKTARNRAGNGKSAMLVSYEALNRLVVSALTSLNRRENRAWSRMNSSSIE